MAAQNAKDAADEFVALRAHELAGAKGRKFQLVTFASDEDCRFFYPRRALEFHRQMNTYISRALRERFGVRVQRLALARADYRTWCQRMKIVPAIADDQATRRKFADAHLQLLPEIE